MSAFSVVFKQLRTAKGLTQQEIAAAIGIVPSTISFWERGKSLPSVKTIRQLAEIFEVEYDDLVATAIESAELSNRLNYALQLSGLTIEQLAENAGIREVKLRKLLAGKETPTPAEIVLISSATPTTVEYLATGQGQMNKSEASVDQHVVRTKNLSYGGSEAEDANIRVPRLSIAASAGSGASNEIEYVFDYFSLPEQYLRRTLGVEPKSARVITVIGDSMEPTLRSGDPILVDTAITVYAADGLYVVLFKDALLVKRLQRKLDETLVVKSDNGSYASYELTMKEEKELKIAGRVVAALRRY